MEINKEILSLEEKLNDVRQNFGIADYCVFAGTIIFSSAVGLYYSFKGRSRRSVDDTEEYLFGGRNMSVFPVAMSLVASGISGISYLGIPTEMYLHGTEFMFNIIGMLIGGYLAGEIFLPVLHELQLTSCYEYLRLRYDRNVQLVASLLFTIAIVCYLPITIYIPAIAFSQVSGVNVHIVTVAVSLLCLFYTCVGGLKAVVWSDVVQMSLMVVAMFALIIKGTFDVGGFSEVWRLNWESGRIEVPSFSLDPTIRQSMWSLTCWSIITTLKGGVLTQHAMQRYLTLPTMSQAKSALWILVVSYSLFQLIGGYAGLMAYATYHDCDPLTTRLAKAKDQLLPLLAMQVLGGFPGMPGLFVAGVFGSALSSLSTALNATASVILVDFIIPNRKTPLSERATRYILRGIVVIFGVAGIALVFVVEKLGSVLQLALLWSGVTLGASFGLFFGGMLLPNQNSKGALWGSLAGLSLSTVFVVGAQRALVTGAVVYSNKMTSVEGCDYNFTAPVAATLVNATITDASNSTFIIFRLSYLYFTFFGGIVTIVCSVIISYATGGNGDKNMDPRLFSPVIRKWLPKRASTVTLPEEQELLDLKLKTLSKE